MKTPLHILCCALVALVLARHARAEQAYVGRYDVYNGFTYFDSPDIKLQERGYHLQLGYNPSTWLAAGFDYSVVTGTLTLRQDLLKPSVAGLLAAQIVPLVHAGIIPPTYQLALPIASTTQTFAAGPQLEFRHFRRVTLFARPSAGAIYEVATPHPGDAITRGLAAQLAPSGQKSEWKGFFGAGWGAEVNFTDHIAVRMQADFVHDTLFTDLLKSARNTWRLSIGPDLHLGRNIAR